MSISQLLECCLVKCVPFKLLRIFYLLLLFKCFLCLNIFGVYVALAVIVQVDGTWVRDSLSLVAIGCVIRIYAMGL